MNWCKPSPCKNGGICRQSGTRYSCQCQTGWTGLYCDVPSVSCEVAAKQQGRFVCLYVMRLKYVCRLPHISAGALQWFTNLLWCLLLPLLGVEVARLCRNSGQCLDAGNTHYCHCQAGYTGSYCEEQVDECIPNPCQNGATCTDYLGGYSCEVSQENLVVRDRSDCRRRQFKLMPA